MSRRRLLTPLAVLLGLGLGLGLLGCGDDDDEPTPPPTDEDGQEDEDDESTAPWPGEGDETQTYDLGDGLVAELPEGWEVTPFADRGEGDETGWEPPCAIREASLGDGETRISLELNGPDCAALDQDQIGNGNHGIYTGLDDVPDPLDVAEQTVTAGTLTTFTQEYFECTNSCTDYQDNVGLLALDAPPDPERPVAVVRDSKGERSMDDLVAVADAIHPA